jgi:hypothetical protein
MVSGARCARTDTVTENRADHYFMCRASVEPMAGQGGQEARLRIDGEPFVVTSQGRLVLSGCRTGG